MGRCLGNFPNGVGGAGLSVFPPIGVEVFAPSLAGAWGGAAAPLMTPTKPPVGIHTFAWRGFAPRARCAAAPTARTDGNAADAAASGRAMTDVCGTGVGLELGEQCGAGWVDKWWTEEEQWVCNNAGMWTKRLREVELARSSSG